MFGPARIATRTIGLTACLTLTSSLMTPAQAIVGSTSLASDGTSQASLAAVAKLNVATTEGSFGCSGSLLGGGAYVLTAAHCLTGANGTATTNSVSVSFLGGTVNASGVSYHVNPGWNGNLVAGNDIALIALANPVTSVAGYSLYPANAQGNTVTLTGYGLTGVGSTGSVDNTFGTLHYGGNQYDAPSGYYSANQISGSIYLYDFDDGTFRRNAFGSSGLGSASEVFIAAGDSGGPGLIDVNGTLAVAGVHSFSSCTRFTCPVNSTFGEVAGDTSVFANSAWLQSVLAVPEPDTYALLLAGLGLLGFIAKRRAPHVWALAGSTVRMRPHSGSVAFKAC